MVPIKIDAQKSEKILTVKWDDGHLSKYPFQLLRAGCPCVECRGGHDQMHADPDADVFERNIPESPAIHLANIALVGSYGLTIQWEDGHQHGIFHWDYLRKLCPCEECRTASNNKLQI